MMQANNCTPVRYTNKALQILRERERFVLRQTVRDSFNTKAGSIVQVEYAAVAQCPALKKGVAEGVVVYIDFQKAVFTDSSNKGPGVRQPDSTAEIMRATPHSCRFRQRGEFHASGEATPFGNVG